MYHWPLITSPAMLERLTGMLPPATVVHVFAAGS
jgi:hypothetical protein